MVGERVEKRATIPLQIAVFSWIIGSIISSITAIYLLTDLLQVIANSFYLAFYPFIFLAIPRLLRKNQINSKIEIIDSAIVALGVSSLLTALLVNVISPKFNGDLTTTFFAVVFPVADVILISLIISLNLFVRLNLRSALLTMGLICFAIADFTNLWLNTSGRYEFGLWSDSIWLLAIALIAESLWHKRDESALTLTTHPIFIALAVIISTALLTLLAVRPGYLPNFILGPSIATLIVAFFRMFVALKEAEEIGTERSLARTDELTGLPNRRKFMAELIDFSNTQGALLLLDLNGFKPINDAHGHAVGDQLLRAVAQRFKRSLPNHSMLARLGGDEFGALISGDYESTMEAALALHASVSYPFAIDGDQIKIGVSVGFVTNDGTRDLMHRADQAMYKAKRENLGVCQL
jgi:diguanylate cyclase (GGDEF)-like protein